MAAGVEFEAVAFGVVADGVGHRWHGRWYGYGEGECWILIDDEWFWNELVCPL